MNLETGILLVKNVERDGWNPVIVEEVFRLKIFLQGMFKDLPERLMTPKSNLKRFQNTMEQEENAWVCYTIT